MHKLRTVAEYIGHRKGEITEQGQDNTQVEDRNKGNTQAMGSDEGGGP